MSNVGEESGGLHIQPSQPGKVSAEALPLAVHVGKCPEARRDALLVQGSPE
jgi:hypothetical protein